MNIIYHLVPVDDFRSTPREEPYLPADYARAGFIHCTRSVEPVVVVANRNYRDDPRAFALLAIDEDRVAAEIKNEPAQDGGLYPHIYGPLNRDAIIRVFSMPGATAG